MQPPVGLPACWQVWEGGLRFPLWPPWDTKPLWLLAPSPLPAPRTQLPPEFSRMICIWEREGNHRESVVKQPPLTFFRPPVLPSQCRPEGGSLGFEHPAPEQVLKGPVCSDGSRGSPGPGLVVCAWHWLFSMLPLSISSGFCILILQVPCWIFAFFQATGNQKHFQAVPSTRKRGLWGGK